MNSNFVLTFVVFVSLALEIGETSQNEKSNEEYHAEDRAKRSIRGTGIKTDKRTSNNLRKAEDQQQKLSLELAIETTKLSELNKLKEAEKINSDTPSKNLSKWQKKLLNEITKTTKKKNELTVKEATSKTEVEKFKQQLATEGSTSSTTVKDDKQVKDKTSKIIKALEDQRKKTLELALATTKLEELEKQKKAENIDVTTAPNKLNKWQNNLLKDITNAKENKADLTVEVAVIQTKVEQLKQHLTGAGGSADSVNSISTKNRNQMNEKIKKAEENQVKIDMDLALATTELEQLEKQKTQSTKTSLTKKHKNLLNNIERVKEKKYNLTLKSALEKTLIEQLKQQLNSSGTPPSNA